MKTFDVDGRKYDDEKGTQNDGNGKHEADVKIFCDEEQNFDDSEQKHAVDLRKHDNDLQKHDNDLQNCQFEMQKHESNV